MEQRSLRRIVASAVVVMTLMAAQPIDLPAALRTTEAKEPAIIHAGEAASFGDELQKSAVPEDEETRSDPEDPPEDPPQTPTQDSSADQAIALPVTVLDCTQPPGAQEIGQFFASGAMPAGCESAAGVFISVEGNGDQVPGGPFTTDAAGRLSVEVAVGTEVVVTQDPSTDAREYEPLIGQVDGISYANPVRLNPVTEADVWGLLFVNVPPDSRSTAVIRALYEQVYSQGNVELIDELYAPDYIEHQPDLPAGREGVRSAVVGLRAAFPDLQVVIADIVTQDDKVWVRSTMRGTNQGEIYGVPPTGQSVEVSWFDVFQLADGKIVGHWGVGDELGLMQQLGFQVVARDPTLAGT